MAKFVLSVVIPAYKAEHTIARAIDSVFVKLTDWDRSEVEIVAVNDNSPDHTLTVLAECKKRYLEQLTVISLDKNLGVANARNVGLRSATGDFVAFLDADDEFSSGATSRVMHIVQKFMPDILLHTYKRVNEKGDVLSVGSLPSLGMISLNGIPSEQVRDVFYHVPFGIMTPAVVYRRSIISDLSYDARFHVGEDRYFGWQAFIKSSDVYLLNEPLVNYYQYGNSLSHTINDDSIKGLLQLDKFFLHELSAVPRFGKGGVYAAERLWIGFITWHYQLVRRKPKSSDLVNLFFDDLHDFINPDWASKQFGVWLPYLQLAEKIKSFKMIGVYHWCEFRVLRVALFKIRSIFGRVLK